MKKIREKFKNGMHRVWTDDEGAEMVEIAIGIGIAAVVIAVVVAIVLKAKGKAEKANDALDGIDIP